MHDFKDVASVTLAPAPDARGAPRQRTMFVVGRIVRPGREQVCIVRNISASGVGIEHGGVLPVGTDLTIETRTMLPTRAIVRWSTARAAGLEFLEPPRTTPPGPAMRPGARIPRSPRFSLDGDARLLIGDRRIVARTLDIGLGGLKLTGIDAPLPPVPTRVELPHLGRTIAGRIRWNCAALAGFQFATPLSSQELAALLDPSESASQ